MTTNTNQIQHSHDIPDWKSRKGLYQIIFEADTREGKRFDLILLIIILFSIVIVMIDSVPEYRNLYPKVLLYTEWTLTILFTIEYIIRIWIVRRPLKYIFSTYGIIDLLAILPTYLSLFIVGAQGLIVIRSLRLLRLFRILKLDQFSQESRRITFALYKSRQKIAVFLFAVLMITIIIGTIMYIVEGREAGFTSIPRSIYWAIVTLTTVGYGDITPQTNLGQVIASIVMIIGYSIIAVPTGIVTSEIMRTSKNISNTQVCPGCLYDMHDDDALFCKKCGHNLADDFTQKRKP